MRYNGIQCLRALAAILVVWSHLKFAADLGSSFFVNTAVGAVGVDIFFVISGFVIAMSAERLNFNARTFLTLRYIRIIPFYWLMTLPIALMKLWIHTWNWHAAANSFLFIPLFDFGNLTEPIHLYGWTLSFEFWFYSLFALLLALFHARAPRILAPLLALGCLIVCFAYHGSWFTPRFLFNPFTLEFAAGTLLYRYRKLLTTRTLPISAALLLLCTWLLLRTDSLGYHMQIFAEPLLGLERALIWGGLGVGAVALTVTIDQQDLFHWPASLVWLGDSSYSIYLIQPFALLAANQSTRHFALPPLLAAAIYVLVAIPGGALLSKLIEMPLIRWVKSKVTVRKQANNKNISCNA